MPKSKEISLEIKKTVFSAALKGTAKLPFPSILLSKTPVFCSIREYQGMNPV